ncbi:MAG TPA: MFS transporter, partial [Thermomicrobiales bacterium]|nr:MFS transporter [Thermomicrobiales bacterium]
QAVKLVPSAVLAVLVIAGTPHLTTIYVLAAILGTANAIDSPARQAFVKELAGPEDLPNAIALNSIVFNSARLIGPALGGVTIALVGVAGCFTIDSISFLAVLVGLAMMREDELYDVPTPPKGRMIGQIAEGVRYAARTPDIAVVLILMAVIGTFGYNFTVVLPLIAKYVLDAGPIGFGILTSSMAIGSLAAAVSIAYTGRVSQRTLLIGASGFPVLLTGLAISTHWPTTIAVLITLGLFSITFSATANSRLQMLSAPELRGRVMSFYTLLFMGSTPIGSLVIGTLADHQGVRMAVFELALICAAGVVAGYLYIRSHATDTADTATLRERVQSS